MQQQLPTGTLTLLFTDIEGSTRLLHTLGERYADALAETRQWIATAHAQRAPEVSLFRAASQAERTHPGVRSMSAGRSAVGPAPGIWGACSLSAKRPTGEPGLVVRTIRAILAPLAAGTRRAPLG